MIRLYTSYYKDKILERENELKTCLQKNIECKSIDKILCFIDCEPPLIDNKIEFIHSSTRPTYKDFFTHSIDTSKIYISSDSIVTVVANSDIYFDETIGYVSNITDRDVYALTRWDVDEKCQNGKFYNRSDSQDAWIWRGELNLTNVECDFCLGIAGCDNRIAYELSKNYIIKNPSKSIKIYHLHNSGIRNYNRNEPISPPYKYVPISGFGKEKNEMRLLNIHLNAGERKQAYCGAFEKLSNQLGCEYQEYDWLATEKQYHTHRVSRDLIQIVRKYKPTHVWMQIQRQHVITPMVATLLKENGAKVFNWTGDVRQPTPQWFLDIGKRIHKTGFTNYTDIDYLNNRQCNAEFFQIGFDPELFADSIEPKHEADIVFMGNYYSNMPLSPFRREVCNKLKERYGSKFQMYGAVGGRTTRDIEECSIYKGAKIALNISQFNLPGYTSDRFFRILASGCFCLNYHFDRSDVVFEENKNAITFYDIEDLYYKIDYYLEHEDERNEIAKNGKDLVWGRDTWEKRIFNDWTRSMNI